MACSESDNSSTTSSTSDGTTSSCGGVDSATTPNTTHQPIIGLVDLFGVQLEVS